MKISCVISRNVDKVDAEKLRDLGPLYGSWTTWKEHKTDNVVCTDLTKAYELMNKAFHAVCNFHIPQKFKEEAGTLPRVQHFNYIVDAVNSDDLAATYVACSQNSAVVLLVGFDFSKKDANLTELLGRFDTVQFVGVSEIAAKVSKAYSKIENITFDTVENVIKFAEIVNTQAE